MSYYVIDNLDRKELADGVSYPGHAWRSHDDGVLQYRTPEASFPCIRNPHEQMGMVIAGSIELEIDGDRRFSEPWRRFTMYVPMYSTGARPETSPCVWSKCFSPPREDFSVSRLQPG